MTIAHPAGRGYGFAACLILALSIAAIPFALHMRIDNNLDRWINADEESAARYASFLDTFGTDEFVLVAYDAGDPFDVGALDLQVGVLETIEKVDGVAHVLGIPAIFRDLYGGEDPGALREEFASSPFYDAFLYQPATGVAGLVVSLERAHAADGRTRVVNAVREAVGPFRAAGWEVHLAGPPLLNVAIDESSERESRRTFPLAIAGSALVLALLFRSIRAVIVAMSCGGLAILLTLGLMGACGYPLTMVTSVLPSLLWVLALAGIIHLLRAYQQHGAEIGAGPDALRAALRDVAPPCAMASITTAFGFLSLRFAGMDPVRELGLFVAAGLLLSLAVNLLVGPMLIRTFGVPVMVSRTASRGIWGRLAALAVRAPVPVAVVSVLLITMCIGSMAWIRVEVDPLAFLPDDSATVGDYEYVAENLGGYYSLEVVADTPDGWMHAPAWPVLDQLTRQLGAIPGVARVLSPLDVLRKLQQWNAGLAPEDYQLPRDGAEAQRLVDQMDPSMGPALSPLVSADGTQVRLSMLINVMSSEAFNPIVAETDQILAALPGGFSGHATGIVRQLVSAQFGLVSSQLRSFGAAFVIIFMCLVIGLRSLRLVLVSIPANLLPILAAFATMALSGIALDGATVMMASVALGIAVDDTVHMLSAYRRARSSGLEPREACEKALVTVGPAMVITTATACIGFFALMRSEFLPIAWFGMLSGIAMAVALAADFFLVPALLLVFQSRKRAQCAR